MDGEAKTENKISFVERINRESGRTTEDYKKEPKKEIWILEDVTGNEYASGVPSSGGRQGANSSWLQKGRRLFEDLFYDGKWYKFYFQNCLNKF